MSVSSSSVPLPHWLKVVLILLAVFGFARAATLVLHRPLIGLANSYDEVRYSGCFDMAPIRPGVPPDRYNPQAPLRLFAFGAGFPSGTCTPSSDLLFTAPVALGWKISEIAGISKSHSIGKLGAVRLLAWCVLAACFVRAWAARRQADVACALLACTSIVFLDPANTVLFNTWYAEPAATFGLYLCGVGALLTLDGNRRVFWLATMLGAAMLGGSKLQHAALPFALAVACLAAGGRAARTAALALTLGGVLGLGVSLAGSASSMSQGMQFRNRGNFVLMVLLPNVEHPLQTAAQIGLDVDCAARAGPHGVWALGDPIEQSCPSLARVSSPRAWAALASEPAALINALAGIPHHITPWISNQLGLVEGREYAHLPASLWSLDRLLGDDSRLALILLILPWGVFAASLLLHAGPLARTCAAMCAMTALEVPVVAMFGDGYSDFAKHAQLALVAALTSLSVPLAGLVGALLRNSGRR